MDKSVEDYILTWFSVSPPSRETAMMAVVRDGKIVKKYMTVGGRSSVKLPKVDEIVELVQSEGADYVVSAHSHPDELVLKQSRQDVRVHALLQRRIGVPVYSMIVGDREVLLMRPPVRVGRYEEIKIERRVR